MAARRTVELTEDERQELLHILHRDRRPYLRDKAAAILKVAAGMTAHQVALRGLNRPYDPDTIYGWLDEFQLQRQVLPQPPRRGGFSPLGRS